MATQLTLKIILQKPTPGVVYGLQKGKGSNYETIQKQLANSGDLTFEFPVGIKFDEGRPVFFGPFTHGSPVERFIYIDIGTYAGQTGTQWGRRLKIPLKGITSSLFERFTDDDCLLATLPGSGGKDGGPTCGTIQPPQGWKKANRMK